MRMRESVERMVKSIQEHKNSGNHIPEQYLAQVILQNFESTGDLKPSKALLEASRAEMDSASVPDEEILKAIEFGYDFVKQTIELINELVAKVGQEKTIKNPLNLPSEEITAKIKELCLYPR